MKITAFRRPTNFRVPYSKWTFLEEHMLHRKCFVGYVNLQYTYARKLAENLCITVICQRQYAVVTKHSLCAHQLRPSNTSIAACLESCIAAERRPTIYSWPVYDILVLHFKRQLLSAGWYVFLYKVRAFRTCL